MSWVSQNPPPAHLFLISGDGDFAGILHRLRMINYNILLATRMAPPDVLCSAATITWEWSSLMKGEDLSGKHFNHPPDGSLRSWYGNNYKVTRENSRYSIENSASLRNFEVNKPSLDLKVGPVPNSVVKKVRNVLRSHPKGISITNLREEVRKCIPHLDKTFCGYRTFSRFLLSIPYVELQPLGDGRFCVRLVPLQSPEAFESNGEDKNNGREANETSSTAVFHERSVDYDSKSNQPVNSHGTPVVEYVDAKSSFPSFVERHVSQPPKKSQSSSVCSERVEDMATAQPSKIQPSLKDDKVSKSETGSLKTSSIKLPDNGTVGPEDACHKIQEKSTTLMNHSAGNDQTTVENIGIANYESGNLRAMDENPTRKEVDEVYRIPDSSSVDDSLVDKRPAGSAKTYREGPKFFSWIRSWWPFWKSNKSGDLTAHQNKMVSHVEASNVSELHQTVQIVNHLKEPKSSAMDQNVDHSEMPELFSSGSFWNDVESFVFTPKGSCLVLHSRSREDMACKLQKDGPLVLRSLTENDNLQLVESLIAEKKWVQESPSQAFPFRLTQSIQKNSLVGQSHGANNLRSLFLSKTSQSNVQKSVEHDVKKHNQSIPPNRKLQSNLQKSFECDVEKHNQSVPHTRVCATSTETEDTEQSRNILEDCQKLVSEILREHPDGYNISTFRGLFIDRYGYNIDVQKLGYQKLTKLLRLMSGVKVESTYIFPSVPAVSASSGETFVLKTEVTNASHAHAVSNSDSEFESAPKDDNMESPWEELGPVSVNNSNQSDLEPKLSQKVKEIHTLKHPDYESFVSDYDSSESKEQDSSLLQALDLLHSSKEGENSVKKSDNVDVMGNSLVDVLNSSTESTKGALLKIPSANCIEKQKSQKKYSFVADPVSSNKTSW